MKTPAPSRSLRAVGAALFLVLSAALHAQNPVPHIVGPTQPMTVAPGSGALTLNVYGANFVPGAVVNWNYQPRSTSFVYAHELQAQILASDVEQNTAGFISVTNPPPGGGNSSSSWAQVEVHDPISTFTFGPPATSAGGGWLLLSADFNHDTLLDLVGQSGPSDLALSYGESSGVFQFASVAGYFYDGGMGGTYGDFNNDGLLDLAYVASVTDNVPTQMNIMLGQSNGQFSLGSQIKGNNAFENVIAGDFNGDGKLDLIIGDIDAFRVYLGNGDGTFKLSKNYQHGAFNLVVADFNGDGKLDIAAITYLSCCSFEVNVFYGRGDGSFLPTPQTLATIDGSGPCGQRFLQVSDFNGDGIPDLAFCSLGQIGIIIGKGKGTFQQPVFITVPNNPEFTFAVGDLNDDGKVDLMVSQLTSGNIPAFSVLLGNGDGTFQSPEPITFQPAFDAELGIIVGDFGSKGALGLAIPKATLKRTSTLSSSFAILNHCGRVVFGTVCEPPRRNRLCFPQVIP
jgi:hypothetical protein